jgi:hypothetical protein
MCVLQTPKSPREAGLVRTCLISFRENLGALSGFEQSSGVQVMVLQTTSYHAPAKLKSWRHQ